MCQDSAGNVIAFISMLRIGSHFGSYMHSVSLHAMEIIYEPEQNSFDIIDELANISYTQPVLLKDKYTHRTVVCVHKLHLGSYAMEIKYHSLTNFVTQEKFWIICKKRFLTLGKVFYILKKLQN